MRKKADGGGLAQSGKHQEATNAEKDEKMHDDIEDHKDRGHQKVAVTKKKGGEVKRRKRGGKVEGKEPHARLDRRARGGRMGSPAHPMSGAEAPNLGYAHGNLRAGSEGAGKDPT